MPRNIELKARLHDVERARSTARSLTTEYLGSERQTDTYFVCRRGRLKLREIAGRPACLVWYERPDAADAKLSDYRLLPITEPADMKDLLAAAFGIVCVVEKLREIFLIDNVRVHLDDVVGLGRFLEFEAVLGNGVDDVGGHSQLASLQQAFGLSAADLLSRSYADMLSEKSSLSG